MNNEFTSQVNLAMIAFAKQAYYDSIVALAMAYTDENLWSQAGEFQAPSESLSNSLEIITRLIELPEIEVQDFVHRIIQQMQEVLETTHQNSTEVFEQAIYNTRHLVDAFYQGLRLLKEQGVPIGVNQDPHIKLGFFLEHGKINVHLYGKISNSPSGLNSVEAQQLQDAFLQIMDTGSNYQQMINLAARLSNQGQYEDSNTLLVKIIEQYPEEKASSLNLIGANWFFLTNYEQAIEYYVKARDAGESEDMIDFNVWEACRELYKEADTPEEALHWKNYYKRLFPQGKHRF
ncbi:hypothetical protein [uncultured Microscilla sp.]|uniref:tetratricopeptide repeat protein n=1 Tax=uncultured Microscilla sp. TaxID=432653 RepID=UPI0026395060|nr:hypothetical protein [uncultured Microscilla sp.]